MHSQERCEDGEREREGREKDPERTERNYRGRAFILYIDLPYNLYIYSIYVLCTVFILYGSERTLRPPRPTASSKGKEPWAFNVPERSESIQQQCVASLASGYYSHNAPYKAHHLRGRRDITDPVVRALFVFCLFACLFLLRRMTVFRDAIYALYIFKSSLVSRAIICCRFPIRLRHRRVQKH